MKKYFVAAALLFAGITASFADGRERPITLEQLPAPAQEFLASNFKDLTLAFAVEDPKFIGSEYEVTYTDRTGKKRTATAFSWEKTDKAEALRADARLK